MCFIRFDEIAQPLNVGRKASFVECSIISSTFIGFEETYSYWSVQFFSVIHLSSSISMAPVSFIKTTESYEVSLITISLQTSMTPVSFVKNKESYKVC